ncbi:hypothetical protein GCM10010384_60620 [Streptomyces djakartensis]|uniref:Uncharacterized protein n=1 Tax=Streptomyces djakartensis TaxID=68193 RepID=A0ABQ3AFZ4_9ACTN|nr:hypothetical protein GCM10010384_60620 [Streptomyces djakartensis]
MPDRAAPAGCTLSADGAYAARLASAGESWFPERWTLDGPEPYAVPLPRNQPEEPGTEVQPMGDGRVLIHRLVAGRHAFSLLYPTGPGTGELPLGAVECPAGTVRLGLLPPAPCGEKAYALAVGPRSTTVWLVAGGDFGPERLAELPGRCSGGVWLDRTGRLLALDRETGGRTKTVVVDLARGGEVSPLLQIAAGSDDRLLLADHDSGLLIVRSDAPSPGQDRLGWGVLGSTLPVRFPECLRLRGCAVTPFAIQPGQTLTPESCAVALRVDGPAGSWIGVWRPAERRMHHLPAPEGWLAGTGLWTPDGMLRLPYATPAVPCGVAQVNPPAASAVRQEPGAAPPPGPGTGPGLGKEPVRGRTREPDGRAVGTAAAPGHPPEPASTSPEPACASPEPASPEPAYPAPASPEPASGCPEAAPPDPPHSAGPSDPEHPASSAGSAHLPAPATPRPVPLQQAPLGRLVTK